MTGERTGPLNKVSLPETKLTPDTSIWFSSSVCSRILFRGVNPILEVRKIAIDDGRMDGTTVLSLVTGD